MRNALLKSFLILFISVLIIAAFVFYIDDSSTFVDDNIKNNPISTKENIILDTPLSEGVSKIKLELPTEVSPIVTIDTDSNYDLYMLENQKFSDSLRRMSEPLKSDMETKMKKPSIDLSHLNEQKIDNLLKNIKDSVGGRVKKQEVITSTTYTQIVDDVPDFLKVLADTSKTQYEFNTVYTLELNGSSDKIPDSILELLDKKQLEVIEKVLNQEQKLNKLDNEKIIDTLK